MKSLAARRWLVLTLFLVLALQTVALALPDGDVDGDGRVSGVDALLLLRAMVGLDPVTPTMLAHGDVDPLGTDKRPRPNGIISVGDVLLVLKRSVGLVTWDSSDGTNQAPVANAGTNQTITLSAGETSHSVALTGSGSDSDGTIASYAWIGTPRPTQPNAATTTVILAPGTYTFTLVVTDDKGATSAPSQVTIVVNPHVNQLPVANAGTNQTITLNAGETSRSVTLTGSGSDNDGTIAHYAWSGSPQPSPANLATATVNLAAGIYTFTLVVTDDAGGTSAPARVTVTVNPHVNLAPVANAGGNRTITLNAGESSRNVTLTGSATDSDGTVVSYAWSGAPQPLPATSPTATLTVGPGTYTFSLVATDDSGAASAPALSTITVVAPPAPNQPPVANAGADQFITLPAGQATTTATLSGSGSACEGATVASYAWSGTPPPSTPGLATTKVALAAGSYTFTLVVTDSQGRQSHPSQVRVTVNGTPHQLPVATVGANQTITLPAGQTWSSVTLSGSGSASDGATIAGYAWNGVPAPSDPSAASTGVTLTPGSYTYSLVVTDSLGAKSAPAQVKVVVALAADQPPVANAGAAQSVELAAGQASATVTLASSSSASGGATIAKYAWSGTPSPSPLDAPSTAVRLGPGSYTYTLVVTDNLGRQSAPAQVKVTVAPAPHQAPVANAGTGQSVTIPSGKSTATVTLSGSGSAADGATIANYAWSGTPAPDKPTAASSTVSLPAGSYTYTLTVTDSQGSQSQPALVAITVANAGDQLPVFASVGGTKTVGEGSALSFTVSATDPAGKTLTYSAGTLPIGAAFNPVSRTLSWTPAYGQAGNYQLIFNASNGVTVPASVTVPVTVTATDRAPVFTPTADQSGREGVLLSFAVSATDPDQGDTLYYGATNLPNGASVNPATGLFTWTPGYTQAGKYTVVFTASDRVSGGLTAQQSVQVTVANVNRPPAIATASLPAPLIDHQYNAKIDAADPDLADTLTFTLGSGAPAKMTIDPATGTLSWLPAVTDMGKSFTFAVTVADSAGATASRSYTVAVGDTIVPMVNLVATKQTIPGGKYTVSATASDNVGVTSFTLTVNGNPTVCDPAKECTVTGMADQSAVPGSTIAASATAKDAAGNAGTRSAAITIGTTPDTVPPTVTLTAPQHVTAGSTVTLSAVAADDQGVDRLVFARTDSGSTIGTVAPITGKVSYTVPSGAAIGSTVPFSVTAYDAAGNSGSSTAVATVVAPPTIPDTTPPVIALSVPPGVAVGGQLAISLRVTDDTTVAGVDLYLAHAKVASYAGPLDPAQSITLPLPDGTDPGTQLVVDVVAVDPSGNSSSATGTCVGLAPTAKQGVVTGAVYDDTTGLPIVGGTVTLSMGNTPQSATTDSRGRYSFAAAEGSATVTVTAAGYDTVDRPGIAVVADQGTRVADARLTPLSGQGSAVTTVFGGTATAPFTAQRAGLAAALSLAGLAAPADGTITVTVPSGSLSKDVQLFVTQVGPQGLQGTALPAGWSPVAALSVTADPADVAVSSAADVAVPNPLGASLPAVVGVVRWDSSAKAWVSAGQATVSGDRKTLAGKMPALGHYAFVVADPGSSAVLPGAGAPLPAAAPPAIPQEVQALVSPDPKYVYYSQGASSDVAFTVTSGSGLGSGAVLWAELDQAYDFYSGEHVAVQPFAQDVVLYTFGLGANALTANFPVSPGSFDGLALESGVISVSAKVPPADAATVGIAGVAGGDVTSAAGETVTFPAGALARSVPVSVKSFDLATSGLTLPDGFTLLGGVTLSAAGAQLALPVSLSIPKPAAFTPAGDLLVVMPVEVLGATRFVVVAGATVSGERIVSTLAVPGSDTAHFPGIVRDGRILVVQSAAALGYTGGVVTGTDAAPFAGAVVTGDTLPLAALSASSGAFVEPVLPGAFNLLALDPLTVNRGVASGTVVAGAFAPADLSLRIEPPAVAAIVPAAGAVDVALADPVVITLSRPVAAASVGSTTVTVASGQGALAGTVSLSADGKTITFRHDDPFTSNTLYAVSVQGLVDLSGTAMDQAGFSSTFTALNTAPPPAPPAGSVTASIPGSDGSTTVTGTQGTAGLHDTVYLVNQTTGARNPVLVNPNGGFSTTVPAGKTDRLQLEITSPAGTTTTVTLPRFQQTEQDGSIKSVVGPEGGTIVLPSGLHLDVPAGAFADGETVRVKELTQAELGIPDMTDAGYQVVAGFEIAASSRQQKYLNVSIPAPAGFDGSIPGIVAKMESAAGEQVYSVVDTAKLIDGRLATSSPPCPGIWEMYGRYAMMIMSKPGPNQLNQLKSFGMAILSMAAPRLKGYVIQPMTISEPLSETFLGGGFWNNLLTLNNPSTLTSLQLTPASVFMAKVQAATSTTDVTNAIAETYGGDSQQVCLPVPGNQPITVAIRSTTTGAVIGTMPVTPTAAGSSQQIVLSITDPLDTTNPQIIMTSWDGVNQLDNGTPITVYFSKPVKVGATDPVYLMTTGTSPQKFTGKVSLDSSGRALTFIPSTSLPLGQTFELHLADVKDNAGHSYADDPAVGPRTFKTYLPTLLWQGAGNLLTNAKITADLGAGSNPPRNMALSEVDFKTIPPDESPDGLWHTTVVGSSSWTPLSNFSLMTFDLSKPTAPKALGWHIWYDSQNYRVRLMRDLFVKPWDARYEPQLSWSKRELHYVDNDPTRKICIDPVGDPNILSKWTSKYCPLGTSCSTKSGGCGDLLLVTATSHMSTWTFLRMFDMSNPSTLKHIGNRSIAYDGTQLCYPYDFPCNMSVAWAPQGNGIPLGVAALSGIDVTHNRRGHTSDYVNTDTTAAYVADFNLGLAMVDLGMNMPLIEDSSRYDTTAVSYPEMIGLAAGPYYRDVAVVRGKVVAVAGDASSGVSTLEVFDPGLNRKGGTVLPYVAKEVTAYENLFETKDAAGNKVSHDMAFITASDGGLAWAEVKKDGTLSGVETFDTPVGVSTRHVEIDKSAMIAYVSAKWTDSSGKVVSGILMADLTGTKTVVSGWDSRYIAKIPFTAPDATHDIVFVGDFRIDAARRLLYAAIDMEPADSGQIPFAVLKLSAAAFDNATVKDATLDPSTSTKNFPSTDGMWAGVLTTDLGTAGKVCVDLDISNTTGQPMTYSASERPLVEGAAGILDFSHGNSGDLTSRLCFDRNAVPPGTDESPTMLQLDISSGGQFVRRLFVRVQPASLIGHNAKLTTTIDRYNSGSCSGAGVATVRFGLTYDAKVTVKVDGTVLDATGVDSSTGLITHTIYDSLPLSAGIQEVDVPATLVTAPGEHALEITAVFNDTPDVREVFTGVIDHEIKILDRFTLGHTQIKGVDLYGGQVSISRSDLSLPAVGPGLQFGRSYSSAGSSSGGVMGAGWSHNYESRLVTGPCGTYLIGGEGSGTKFSKVSGKYQPQTGYHGSLTENSDGTFDFYTKGRTRYRYKASYDPALASGIDRVYILDYIEDTHGNRTELHYNAASPYNLSEVVEKPLDLTGNPVPETDRRKLVFSYANGEHDATGAFVGYGVIPEDRLIKVEAFKGSTALGIELGFGYDKYGNLRSATRDVRSEKYDYYDANVDDRHNLKQVTDPNGNTVQYSFYAKTDTFPGENADGTLGAGSLSFSGKEEFLKSITDGSGSEQASTGYVYDFSQLANKVVTTVTTSLPAATPPGTTFVTRYTMNPRGNVVETTVPGGNSDGSDNTVYSTWSYDVGIADVYVKEQKDGAGRRSVFDYDANGNLLSETVYPPATGFAAVTDAAGAAVTSVATTYTYDSCTPTFNKAATVTDAEGNLTTNVIDCSTGDLMSVTKSSGTQHNVTSFTYWPNGVLKTSTDPNTNVTSYTAYKYNQPETVVAPQGLTTTNSYDDRGRLTDRSDTFGHHTAYTVYDNLDRLRHSIEYSGDAAKQPDHEVDITYYDAGQKKDVTSGLTTTSYTLDTLNRVSAETVQVTDADGTTSAVTTSYAYDANGNKTYQKDRRGIETWVDFDLMNRDVATKSKNPETGALVLLDHAKSYDHAGNLVSVTDLHGYTTTFASDWLYRPTTTTLPRGGYTIVKSYDRVGNVLSVTDPNGKKTVTSYDYLGRVVLTTDAVGRQTKRSYDDNGNVIKTEHITASGVTDLVERDDAFDGLNRPTASYREFKDPVSGQLVSYKTSYSYDDTNNVRRVKNETRGIVVAEKTNHLDQVLERTVAEGTLDFKTTYTYDAGGNVTTVTDPQSSSPNLTATYDALNRKISVTYPSTPDDTAAVVEKFYYDGSGNVVKSVDRRGIVQRVEYDFLARVRKRFLTESISNSGTELLQEETVYDDSANMATVWDAKRNKTEHYLNALQQEEKTLDADGAKTERTFDGVNKLTETDRRGIKTAFVYDDVNRLVERHEYDLAGNLASKMKTVFDDDADRRIDYDRFTGTTPTTVQTITRLDQLGRVRQVAKKDAGLVSRYGSDTVVVETTSFDENGNKVEVTDANGTVTRFAYDDADRQVQKVEGYGTADAGTTSYSYDKVGNLLSFKGPRDNGGTFDWRYSYDARYRKKTDENAAHEITTYGYDAADNRTSVTRPNGHKTQYVYDELGKLLAVDDTDGAAGGVTRYAYDAYRNRTAQQDANGNLTTYTYDTLNRLTDTYEHLAAGALAAGSLRGASPGGDRTTAQHWQYGYDLGGNQNLVIDARGQRVDSSYDYLNRLASKAYSNHQPDHTGQAVFLQPQSHSYAYDLGGNLVRVEEQKKYFNGNTSTQVTLQTFDPVNRLETRTNPDGKKLTFTYDRQGNRASMTDADGNVTGYQYNARGWLSTLTVGDLKTNYTYYPDGLLKKTTYPNGTVEDMGFADAYDAVGRLTRVVNHAGNVNDPISQYVYHFDASGNRDYQDEQHKKLDITTAQRTTYGYDALDRLTTVGYGSTAAMAYGYDAAGNRLTEKGTDPATGAQVDRSYSYDRLNRLVSVTDKAAPDKSVVFEYDANGNTVSRNTGQIDATSGKIADTSAKTYFDYDIRDKMSLVTAGGVKTADFDYDYLGMRTRKTGDGYADSYLYDQTAVIQEYDPSNLITKRKYNYGTALHSLVTAGDKPHYYLVDGLLSTSEITDETGAVVDSYQYDAWGGMRKEYSLLANDRKFTGHYLDKETGLHYMGARYYDDATGRFLTQDPYLGDIDTPPSLHRYMYANDNPLFYTDPTGFIGEAGYMTMKSLFGLDAESVAKDNREGNNKTLFAKECAYDLLNVISLGYEKRQDARVEKFQSGTITEDDLLIGSTVDAVTSAVAVVASGGAGSLVTKAVGPTLLGSVGGGIAAGALYSATEQSGEVLTYNLTEGRLGKAEISGYEVAKSAAIGGLAAGVLHGVAKADAIIDELRTVRLATPELPGGMRMAPLENVRISTVGALQRGMQRVSMMSRMPGGEYNWQRAIDFERGLVEIPGDLKLFGNKWNWSSGFNPVELNQAGIISKPGMYARIWGTRAKALAQNLITRTPKSPRLADNLGSLKGDFDVQSNAPELQDLSSKSISLRYKYANQANKSTGETLIDTITKKTNPYHPAPADHGVLPVEIQSSGAQQFIKPGYSREGFNWTTEELYRWGNLTLKKPNWIGAREVITFKKPTSFK